MLVTDVFSHRERHLQEMCQDRHSQQQQKKKNLTSTKNKLYKNIK